MIDLYDGTYRLKELKITNQFDYKHSAGEIPLINYYSARYFVVQRNEVTTFNLAMVQIDPFRYVIPNSDYKFSESGGLVSFQPEAQGASGYSMWTNVTFSRNRITINHYSGRQYSNSLHFEAVFELNYNDDPVITENTVLNDFGLFDGSRAVSFNNENTIYELPDLKSKVLAHVPEYHLPEMNNMSWEEYTTLIDNLNLDDVPFFLYIEKQPFQLVPDNYFNWYKIYYNGTVGWVLFETAAHFKSFAELHYTFYRVIGM